MQQRYYDLIIGRFYSNDPVGFSASNPMMFNWHAYGTNNPYKFVDPTGKTAELAEFADTLNILLSGTQLPLAKA